MVSCFMLSFFPTRCLGSVPENFPTYFCEFVNQQYMYFKRNAVVEWLERFGYDAGLEFEVGLRLATSGKCFPSTQK